MGWMFYGCNILKEIKGINNFNTNKVTNMKSMFQECNALEYLDLSNFNTSNATDMSWMFNGCNKLKQIKGINNFNINKTTIDEMFNDCDKLGILILKFNSTEQSITNFPMICHKSDIFSNVLQKLYLKFPQFKSKNIQFTANGGIIDTSITLEKNNIKNSTSILVCDFE